MLLAFSYTFFTFSLCCQRAHFESLGFITSRFTCPMPLSSSSSPPCERFTAACLLGGAALPPEGDASLALGEEGDADRVLASEGNASLPPNGDALLVGDADRPEGDTARELGDFEGMRGATVPMRFLRISPAPASSMAVERNWHLAFKSPCSSSHTHCSSGGGESVWCGPVDVEGLHRLHAEQNTANGEE